MANYSLGHSPTLAAAQPDHQNLVMAAVFRVARHTAATAAHHCAVSAATQLALEPAGAQTCAEQQADDCSPQQQGVSHPRHVAFGYCCDQLEAVACQLPSTAVFELRRSLPLASSAVAETDC